jgi:hypothetical protein
MPIREHHRLGAEADDASRKKDVKAVVTATFVVKR